MNPEKIEKLEKVRNLEVQKFSNNNNAIEKKNCFMINDYYCYSFFIKRKKSNITLFEKIYYL